MRRRRDPCVYATRRGHPDVLVLAHPACPEHGDGEDWRVVEVPGWLWGRGPPDEDVSSEEAG